MNNSSENLKGNLLWEEFKEGNQLAFEKIYRLHYPHLFRYGLKLSFAPIELEDAIQDLFLKLWRNRANLGAVRSVRAYLFKSFRRVLLDGAKKNQILHEKVQTLAVDEIRLSVEDLMIHREINKEQQAKLQSSLNQLTSRQREVIYLKFYKGFSYNEIGDILQINYQTIRNSVYEAIKGLKKHLAYVTH